MAGVPHILTRRPRLTSGGLVAVALLVVMVLAALRGPASAGAATGTDTDSSGPAAGVVVTTSSTRGTDGRSYTVTNHLTPAAFDPGPHEYLLAWAGAVGDAGNAASPDFLAVIDVTRGSRHYGEVVNTATVGPQLQSEPHHLQYNWKPGQPLYATGILGDTTWVFDTQRLPALRIQGINLPHDTPCGTAPDAAWVLPDNTALVTYMGGPNVSGSCTYSDGSSRVGNGFAGSPGEIVHMAANGRTLSETPAAVSGGEDPALCHNIPALPQASCANPHGVTVRLDLNRVLTSDFAEIRNYLATAPIDPKFDPNLARNTIRSYTIGKHYTPELLSVSRLHPGPRAASEQYPVFHEDKLPMEIVATNQPRHKGAFAGTMWGGAIYYTPDLTKNPPQWQEVFDDTTAYNTFHPDGGAHAGGDGGSWLGLTADDRYLVHTVLGQNRRLYNLPDTYVVGMVYVLDVHKLVQAGPDPRCRIDTIGEITAGGEESDCPALVSVLPVADSTTGGPHWGAMDDFARLPGGYVKSGQTSRIAYADYFVAALDTDGNHQVCIANMSPKGKLSLDTSFRDQWTGRPCINFNRAAWPHGDAGAARPHGVLFVTSRGGLRRP